MVYSEAGGVAKTTTAVSLAMSWAEQGQRVVLIDLDPRAAATKWLDVEPSEPGLHIGAVIGNPDPTGWIQELAVPSGWHENLRVVPSDRSLSHQEADRADHAHLRLRMGLTDLHSDLVVIDCPNRQGGPLTQNAFTASDGVIYAARPTSDGCDGVHGARQSVAAFKQSMALLGAADRLTEVGIVVSDYQDHITPKDQTVAVEELRETGLLLPPGAGPLHRPQSTSGLRLAGPLREGRTRRHRLRRPGRPHLRKDHRMNEKQLEPDLRLRAQRRKPTPAPHTPAPGAVIPVEPATASDPAGGYAPLARRGAPTVALNVRVPEAIRDAVRREAATNPATPSQAAVIEALVRAHLMH